MGFREQSSTDRLYPSDLCLTKTNRASEADFNAQSFHYGNAVSFTQSARCC